MAALIAASTIQPPAIARAQMGQAAMAPAGGVVNRAVQGFRDLNANGPGFLYYGINAADRGLGYQGSYMTLGGYIPGYEDGLGGLWAADLRSHLSVYGGFFSNVGAVRKQFLGGTLLGVGVYWDYDGDLNQYSDSAIPLSDTVFAGGQVYNQVGVSAEWLTDFGNLRSNGYIPVGTTAEYVGPFVGNAVLCRNGVNAGLAGTDLEVGAYIPGLSDWAGMISVGGYAYGNARYNFPDGQDVVPWFGGVYTRLDMTFIENWDFSLQYNNDSYFDSTGFARLTYRMGGSRRRNVPDQMEQPMMRNEHVVRAHQAPVVAVNPETGTPWRVIHVDNSATAPGNGNAESPFTTLPPAELAAANPYDIVYVHQGVSAVSPYVTPAAGYSFSAPNQYLIGEGSGLAIPTVSCGPRSFFGGSGAYPVITNPLGAAIAIDQPGTFVSHFQIVRSPVGITDGAGLLAGVATVSDVIIQGDGPGQRGVEIASSTGTFVFDRLQLRDLTNDGLLLSSAGGIATVTSSTFTNVIGRAFAVTGENARGTVTSSRFTDTIGTAIEASGSGSRVVLASSTVAGTTEYAVRASGTSARIDVADSRIIGTGSTGIDVGLFASGSGSVIRMERSTITSTGSDSIVASGDRSVVTMVSSTVANSFFRGILVSGSNAEVYVTGTSAIVSPDSDGIKVSGSNAKLLVQDTVIDRPAGDGINVESLGSSTASRVTVLRSTIRQPGITGITAVGLTGTAEVVQVYSSTITEARVAGIQVTNSNLDVGRDPVAVTAGQTSIRDTGTWGVWINGQSRARINSTVISGVTTGIEATNTILSSTTSLTANRNTITVDGSGTGIVIGAISGTIPPPLPPLDSSFVRAQLLSNRISTVNSGTVTGISLTANNTGATSEAGVIRISGASNAVDLGIRNFGTPVDEDPDPSFPWILYGQPAPLLPPTPAPLLPP